MILKDLYIDRQWSLFLDRDGVINRKLENDYVKSIDEFEFTAGALQAMRILSEIFGHIFIVTNQQGIHKGIMSVKELDMIHRYMQKKIIDGGGRITKIYHSPYLEEEKHPTRKPSTGMGEQALQDYPGVDFKKSLMVGDSMSDMEFGKNLEMFTVGIGEKDLVQDPAVDFAFGSLYDFAVELVKKANQ
ncbi:MAG: HAD-IIIA family hydrolase [Bacteroidales bacterium]